MSVRAQCFGCDKYFTVDSAALVKTYFCAKCLEESEDVNKALESQRLSTIRNQLIDQVQKGMSGVIAARAKVAEFVIVNWVNNPADIPTRKEVVDIQSALGLPSYGGTD